MFLTKNSENKNNSLKQNSESITTLTNTQKIIFRSLINIASVSPKFRESAGAKLIKELQFDSLN